MDPSVIAYAVAVLAVLAFLGTIIFWIRGDAKKTQVIENLKSLLSESERAKIAAETMVGILRKELADARKPDPTNPPDVADFNRLFPTEPPSDT